MNKEFLQSIPGMTCVLLLKLFMAAVFTVRRVLSLFFFLLGLRIFYGALHFF